MILYLYLWISISIATLISAVLRAEKSKLFSRNYIHFLLVPWRSISFVIAISLLIALSFVAHDPTWDMWSSLIMGLLTFYTAPFSVSVLVSLIRKTTVSKFDCMFALVLSLLSSSWSYDLYCYLKMREYPETWFWNLVLSMMMYLAGGAMWNLSFGEGKMTMLSNNTNYPPNNEEPIKYSKLILWALPFMVLFGWIVIGTSLLTR